MIAVRGFATMLCFATVTFLASSCDNLSDRLDRWAFESFGGTFMSTPNQVTMKEIHLDNGKLHGREIIVSGTVVNLGRHATHLVVTDETARLLVVTTSLTDAAEVLDNAKAKHFRILGTVERGKKGLPYVLAKAITLADKGS